MPGPYESQPVDHILTDHQDTVEQLRKMEIRYALKRSDLFEYHWHKAKYESKPIPKWVRCDLATYAVVLENLWLILRNYYEYPETYLEDLLSGEPMDVEGHLWDGFWCIDLGRAGVDFPRVSRKEYHDQYGRPPEPEEGE
jgi:hypothetical protein